MRGRIPIKAAERLSEQYECPVVVVYAIHDGGERFTVTTYGKTKALCRHAADLGKKLADAILGGVVVPAPAPPAGAPDAPAVWESVDAGLLAACEAALWHLRPEVEDEDSEGREGAASRLYDQLLAAIARAKGHQPEE